MSDFTIACAIVVALMLAYAVGYRNGLAYCMRELKPLEDAAKELHRLTRRE